MGKKIVVEKCEQCPYNTNNTYCRYRTDNKIFGEINTQSISPIGVP